MSQAQTGLDSGPEKGILHYMKNAIALILFVLAACSSQPVQQKPEPQQTEQQQNNQDDTTAAIAGIVGQM